MNIARLAQLNRFKELVLILVKYGFDDVVERMELPAWVKLGAKVTREDHDSSTYERIRMCMEELGPSFIKIGQILSMRPDLVPEGLILELKKLQDQVQTVPYEDIKVVVEEELECGLEVVFSAFEREPLAAASLGQVHRAVLRKEDVPVAVKVLKPGMRNLLSTDLSMLEGLAETLNYRVEALKQHDLPSLVSEIKRSAMHELDFVREARNMRIGRQTLREEDNIRIPAVYDAYVSERVLVMELFQGTRLKEYPLDDVEKRQAMGVSGMQLMLRQILEYGFFHADPHPGNYMVLEDGNLGLLDWGMAGRLSLRMRYNLIDLITAVADKDGERVVDMLAKLSVTDAAQTNRALLEREVLDILDIHFSLPVQEMRVGRLMLDMANLMRRMHLKVPGELAMLIKGLLSGEGTARMLYPELNVIEHAEPYFRQLALERYKPKALWKSLRLTLRDIYETQRKLPGRIDAIMHKMEHGKFAIQFEHKNLSGLRETMENVTNRLSFAVIIGAIIIGSSLIITTGIKPYLFGYPALGVIGYLISTVLGLWLVYNIIRSKKL